jgi:PGF-CTERM protein
MTMSEEWNVNRIDPVIIGGPYTSSAQYECDVNNLAGPDNILVLDDGRVLVGEDTNKHESNMVWLWEDLSEPLKHGGTISVDYVNLINTPADKNSTWDYRYRTEVNELEIGPSYTAIIIIKEFGFEDWKGLWWWNNIESDGQQYDQTFSLPRGCYSINTSLYESQDLSSDVKNATILSDATFDFVVGTGTCADGIYSEEVSASNETGDMNDDLKDDDESVPGFGILLSIIAIIGAFAFANRRM